MKKLSRILNLLPTASLKQAGFTMIELLVVIAVIGVLAVAVLSSINPIEQINKGRDTRTRSDAAQLINAVDRYYSIHEKYPWNVVSADYTPSGTVQDTPDAEYAYTGNVPGATPTDADMSLYGWITTLMETSEVKAGFTNRLEQDNAISMFKAQGPNQTMYACFYPSSNAFKQEAWDNCKDGITPHEPTDLVSSGITPCTTAVGSTDAFDPDVPNYICLP